MSTSKSIKSDKCVSAKHKQALATSIIVPGALIRPEYATTVHFFQQTRRLHFLTNLNYFIHRLKF